MAPRFAIQKIWMPHSMSVAKVTEYVHWGKVSRLAQLLQRKIPVGKTQKTMSIVLVNTLTMNHWGNILLENKLPWQSSPKYVSPQLLQEGNPLKPVEHASHFKPSTFSSQEHCPLMSQDSSTEPWSLHPQAKIIGKKIFGHIFRQKCCLLQTESFSILMSIL